MDVYLASPLGFADSSTGYRQQIMALFDESGYRVYDPWSDAHSTTIIDAAQGEKLELRLEKLAIANHWVGQRNRDELASCRAVLGVLDGVDVDSGTASEIGYAYALNKRITGLRTDFRRTGDNQGAIVNLQVQYWIEASGGAVYTTLEDLEAAIAAGTVVP